MSRENGKRADHQLRDALDEIARRLTNDRSGAADTYFCEACAAPFIGRPALLLFDSHNERCPLRLVVNAARRLR